MMNLMQVRNILLPSLICIRCEVGLSPYFCFNYTCQLSKAKFMYMYCIIVGTYRKQLPSIDPLNPNSLDWS